MALNDSICSKLVDYVLAQQTHDPLVQHDENESQISAFPKQMMNWWNLMQTCVRPNRSSSPVHEEFDGVVGHDLFEEVPSDVVELIVMFIGIRGWVTFGRTSKRAQAQFRVYLQRNPGCFEAERFKRSTWIRFGRAADGNLWKCRSLPKERHSARSKERAQEIDSTIKQTKYHQEECYPIQVGSSSCETSREFVKLLMSADGQRKAEKIPKSRLFSRGDLTIHMLDGLPKKGKLRNYWEFEGIVFVASLDFTKLDPEASDDCTPFDQSFANFKDLFFPDKPALQPVMDVFLLFVEKPGWTAAMQKHSVMNSYEGSINEQGLRSHLVREFKNLDENCKGGMIYHMWFSEDDDNQARFHGVMADFHRDRMVRRMMLQVPTFIRGGL